MKFLGRHLLVELSGCDCSVLNDQEKLREYMCEAVRRSGATIVETVFHRYNPHGVSGVVVIAESHISLHTWPEYGYAAVDFFTCGETVDPYKAHDYIKEKLGARDAQVNEVRRGIPSPVDKSIKHKPSPMVTVG